jgi:ABC-2 type transport system ATP-binding protein
VPIIEIDSLSREFQRPKRFDGPFGGLRTLTRQVETMVTVENVSFSGYIPSPSGRDDLPHAGQ